MSVATALGSLRAFGIIATSSPALEADCRQSTSAGESMGTLERRRVLWMEGVLWMEKPLCNSAGLDYLL